MIQFDKAPYFPNQLKFNLDGSTSSNPPLTSSPQMIFMQKLSHPSSMIRNDHHQKYVQPMTDRLSFATQIAKMDARCCLQKEKLARKNGSVTQKPVKKTTVQQSNINLNRQKSVKLHHPVRQNGNVKPSFSCISPKKFKSSRSQQTKPQKQSIRGPDSSIYYENGQYIHQPPTKDACVSTVDLVVAQNHIPMHKQSHRTPIFHHNKNCLCLIKKEKLDKSHSSHKSNQSVSPKFERQQEKFSMKNQSATKPKTTPSGQIHTPVQPTKSCLLKLLNKNTSHKSTDVSTSFDDVPFHCTKKPHCDLYTTKERSFEEQSGNHILTNEMDLMCNALHQQLLAMEDVENGIRSRWKSIKYDMIAETKPQEMEGKAEEVQLPIKLVGGKTYAKKPDKEIVRYVKPKPAPREMPSVESPATQLPSTLLTLPLSTIDTIFKNKSSFNSYLHSVSHEPIGKFNPWKVVNELSTEIVRQIVSDVCDEVSDGFDDCVEHVFESEFAVP